MMQTLLLLCAGACALALLPPRPLRGCPPRMTVTDAPVPVRPLPKVPSSAWRWPPVWPFPADFTEPVDNPHPEGGEPLLSGDAAARLRAHLQLYLTGTPALLEIGMPGEALLPELAKERFLVDERSLGASFALPQASASLDAVLVSSGVEYLVDPKDVFKEVWRVLRPGGQCFVAFLSKLEGSSLRPIRMWTTMTDEQKIWIVGSYYYYSAAEGWSNIEGFDLYSENGQQLSFEKREGLSAYVVQATRAETPSLAQPAEHVAVLLSGCRHLSNADRKYCSLRAATRLGELADPEAYVRRLVVALPQLYSVLREVQEIVLPAPVKALLAMLVVETWTDSEAQRQALAMALGLVPSAEDPFWAPIGAATKSMRPKDKVIFLADVLPLFGSPAAPRLAALPVVLSAVVQAVKARLPDATDDDVQLIATEFIATDFLASTSPDAAARLVRYLGTVEPSVLLSIREERTTALSRAVEVSAPMPVPST